MNTLFSFERQVWKMCVLPGFETLQIQTRTKEFLFSDWSILQAHYTNVADSLKTTCNNLKALSDHSKLLQWTEGTHCVHCLLYAQLFKGSKYIQGSGPQLLPLHNGMIDDVSSVWGS